MSADFHWKDFVGACIATYRTVGFFTAPDFDDADKIIARLEAELDFYDDPEAPVGQQVYSFLLSLDTDHVAHINLKKQGAESGNGYYRDTARQLVGCFAKVVDIQETYPATDRVSITLTAVLNYEWVDSDGAQVEKTVQQTFTPMRSWSDLTHFEHMLEALLGDAFGRIRSGMGESEEWVLFIFAPAFGADIVIDAFERRFLPDWAHSAPLAHQATGVSAEKDISAFAGVVGTQDAVSTSSVAAFAPLAQHWRSGSTRKVVGVVGATIGTLFLFWLAHVILDLFR